MARNFSGTNQELVVASAVVTAYPFTVAGPFNADVNTADDVLFSLGNTANNLIFHNLRASGSIAGDPVRFITRNDGPTGTATTTTGFTAGTWHHACAVAASSTSRTVYIDGGSAGTSATDETPAGLNKTTFGQTHIGTLDYDGKLAEWAVWNVALTAAEVATLAKGVNPWKVRPWAIVAYWQMFGRHPTTEPDLVGGFHLTVTGATQAAHPPKAQGLWLPTSRGVFVPAAAADTLFGQSIFCMAA